MGKCVGNSSPDATFQYAVDLNDIGITLVYCCEDPLPVGRPRDAARDKSAFLAKIGQAR